MVYVQFSKATSPSKKMKAVFYDNNFNKIKTTQFGAYGMSDYTKHKDPDRKDNYLSRHRSRENWRDYKSAGALSRWILWNKPTLKASINDYMRRFNLKKY